MQTAALAAVFLMQSVIENHLQVTLPPIGGFFFEDGVFGFIML